MRTLAVIPARYASTRLPGKPLLAETGQTLIEHVWRRVHQCSDLDQVIVATDDERIAAAVRGFGGACAMTRVEHASGTDRIAEVVRQLEANGQRPDIVLNVQGDEPEIDVDGLVRLMGRLREDAHVRMATLAAPFPAGVEPSNPNCVKVVLDQRGRALYFSRALVPYPRDAQALDDGWLLHLGVYAYRRDFLLEFSGWAPSRLEQVEKLEQLRALERGEPIAVELVRHAPPGIDTPHDYEEFVKRWRVAARTG